MNFPATHIFAGHIPCIKGETAGINACTEVNFHPDYTLEQIQSAHLAFSLTHPDEPFFKPVAEPPKLENLKWPKYSNWQ